MSQALISQVSADDSTQIVVVDCTFTEKSGHHTYGLAWFYNDFYSKYKWVSGVVQLGFHSIGRLRSDATSSFFTMTLRSGEVATVAMTAR